MLKNNLWAWRHKYSEILLAAQRMSIFGSRMTSCCVLSILAPIIYHKHAFINYECKIIMSAPLVYNEWIISIFTYRLKSNLKQKQIMYVTKMLDSLKLPLTKRIDIFTDQNNYCLHINKQWNWKWKRNKSTMTTSFPIFPLLDFEAVFLHEINNKSYASKMSHAVVRSSRLSSKYLNL